MATVNETILALASKIEAQLELDANTGVGAVKSDVYHDNLPEGLTKQVVTEVSNYNSDFIAASTYAFGKLAVDAMKGNTGLTTATVEIPMAGKDNVAIATERQHVFNVPSRGEGKPEEITKYGSTTVAYTVHNGKNAGQLKAARNAIVEMATAALKG